MRHTFPFISVNSRFGRHTVGRLCFFLKRCAYISVCCKPTWMGPEHLNKKKLFFGSSIASQLYGRLYYKELSISANWYCHLDDWEIFLALYFIVLNYESESCTFRCNKWANELHNVSSARASRLAKCCHRTEFFVSITSLLKSKLMPEQKFRRFEGRLSAERLLIYMFFIGKRAWFTQKVC